MKISSILPIIMCSGLVFCGCGEKNNHEAASTRQRPAETAQIDLDAALEAAFQQDETPTRPPPQPSHQGTDINQESIPEDLIKALEQVKTLREMGRFNDARQLARRALTHFANHRAAHELRTLERQVTHDLQEATRLRFPVNQLRSASASERDAASRELLLAGEIGRILLRDAVLRGHPRAAVSAAARLADARDVPGINSILERTMASDHEAFVAAMLRVLERQPPPFDLRYIPDLYTFMDSKVGKPHENLIWENVRNRAMADLPVADLDRLLETVTSDRSFEQQRMAQFLATIFIRRCNRNVKNFNALFSHENAHAALSAYVERASRAGGMYAAWARAMAHAFEEFDFSALAKGLVAWYSFDEDSSNQAINQAADQYHGSIRNTGGRVSGVIGTALDFTPDDARVEIDPKETMRTIHHRDYTFSAWVKPDGRPSGEQPDILWGIVVKEGWHLGLFMDQNGHPMMTHYLHGNKAVTAKATKPLVTGRWTLLTGSVDRENGTVRLFINGVREAETRFPQRSMASSDQDGRPVRIGLAKPGMGNWAYRFKGAIDEVRIYNRALNDVDAAAIYALSE